MTETLAHGYSSDSTQRKLANEYKHGRFRCFSKNFAYLVLGTKVASALEKLNRDKPKMMEESGVSGISFPYNEDIAYYFLVI